MFIGKGEWVKKLSAEEERIVSGHSVFFWGQGAVGVFIMQINLTPVDWTFQIDCFKGHISRRD